MRTSTNDLRSAPPAFTPVSEPAASGHADGIGTVQAGGSALRWTPTCRPSAASGCWTPCARPLRRSIRCGKTTGFGRFSFQRIQINAAWRELSLAAIDLIVWKLSCRTASWPPLEPNKLRHRLLHAAARITRGVRRPHLRIAATGPWLPHPRGTPSTHHGGGGRAPEEWWWQK